jgi:hypothetical protein
MQLGAYKFKFGERSFVNGRSWPIAVRQQDVTGDRNRCIPVIPKNLIS